MKSINTKNLILKQIQENDFGFIRDYLSHNETTRYLPLERPYGEDEAIEWFNARLKHWSRHLFGTFILRDTKCLNPIGYCGIEFVKDTEFVDIRYGLVQKAWGKRYAFEAAISVLTYGFNEIDLSIIYGAAVPENIPSINILKELGMRPDVDFDTYGNVVSPFSIHKDLFINK